MKDSEYREGHDPGYVKHAFKTLKKKKKKKKTNCSIITESKDRIWVTYI